MNYCSICPNCGESLRWKRCVMIIFEWISNRGLGVQACEDCLRHPENLNEENIKESLMVEYGWPEKDAIKAAEAIILFAKGVTIKEPVEAIISAAEGVAEQPREAAVLVADR